MDKQTRNQNYISYVEKKSPKAGWLTSLFHAFVMGATICCLGQMFSDIIMLLHAPRVNKSIIG